jgi:hypothetical protein
MQTFKKKTSASTIHLTQYCQIGSGATHEGFPQNRIVDGI